MKKFAVVLAGCGVYDGAEPDGLAMIGFEYDSRLVRFRATFGPYKRDKDGIWFHSRGVGKLRVSPGDSIGFLPLSGAGMSEL
jgi:hypothetical protein